MCTTCWSQAYVLRAIVFPVAGPVGVDWTTFRARLADAWAGATGLANWAVTALRQADVTRAPGMERLPPMPRTYLYPAAREAWPHVDPNSVVPILRAVEGRYRKARLDVVWRCAAALPTYRYPLPYPVHNKAWTARTEDGVPTVTARLGGERTTLRLRGGHDFRRQLAAFDAIVAGDAVRGTLELYRRRGSQGDHRPGARDREPGGGVGVSYRVMAKLVAWFPRSPHAPRTAGQALLRTAQDSLWVATLGDRVWRYHADQVRRWVVDHRKRLQRLAEDQKAEARGTARDRRAVNEARQRAVSKQHRRLDALLHQATAAFAAWADRQGVAVVLYDDTVRGYVESFPWYSLRERLQRKLDELGILLELPSSTPAPAESLELLEVT